MTPPILQIEGLVLRRGTREILRKVTFDARAGEIVVVMGLSGSGKTTLLRAVAGLEPFEAGDVRIGGQALRPERPVAGGLPRRVGMVFQFHHLFEHLTALENVTLAPVHVQRTSRDEAGRRARRLLDDLGVGGRANALPRELSGGEAQRVAIARALALDPPVLLLDEPTASLDPARRADLGGALRELARSGRTLLVTSHADDFVRQVATSVVILADGRIVEAGPPDGVLTAPSHPATRALLDARE